MCGCISDFRTYLFPERPNRSSRSMMHKCCCSSASSPGRTRGSPSSSSSAARCACCSRWTPWSGPGLKGCFSVVHVPPWSTGVVVICEVKMTKEIPELRSNRAGSCFRTFSTSLVVRTRVQKRGFNLTELGLNVGLSCITAGLKLSRQSFVTVNKGQTFAFCSSDTESVQHNFWFRVSRQRLTN